jgi:hypothetical protein
MIAPILAAEGSRLASPVTSYKWKAKYGRMDISQARHVKTLETENARINGALGGYSVGAGRLGCAHDRSDGHLYVLSGTESTPLPTRLGSVRC